MGCVRLRVKTKIPAVEYLDEQHRPCRVDDGDLGAKRDGMPQSRFVRRQPLDGCGRCQQSARPCGRGGARADRIDIS